MMLLAVALTARAFSFSATAPTGQTLYFDVTSAGAVSVVNPDWDYYATPNGDLEIPATVSNNGSTYTVTAIGQRAFRMCTGLTSVVVPQSVHSIGTLAFFGCTALEAIELPSTIDSIASEAFNNCGYYNNISNWVDSSALYVGDYLVRVRTSQAGAITVREGTLGIGGMAMYNCHSLSEVTIAQSVRFIGPLVFKDCAVLDTVHMLSSVPPALAATAFDGAYRPTVKVPCGSLAAYSGSPNWASQHLVEARCPDGIADIDSNAPAIAIDATGLTVSAAEGLRVSVSDIMGRMVASIAGAATVEHIDLPHFGVFVVGIEGYAARKVVYLK